ncbi:anti-phage dCTP deaminase [Sulfuritalea sp.]|uniref:anti-phage dCTP deaminase n=1 Tax=Sulfuritalea sp. TaxID=2480090 RepID=UPI00286D8A81|nr:anti-phage dCTP deaminase [Sulfuritalea sp.]
MATSSRTRHTSSNHPVPNRHPELVFGLIGPAGTDLKGVFKVLRKALIDVGYHVPKSEIKLSKLIEEFLGRDFSNLPDDERVDNLMSEGTRIRECAGHGGAIALLALLGIDRARRTEFENIPEKNAYILHSLKHPEEVETLRNIYGKGFFAISAYSPRESRVDALAARITKSKHLNSTGARAKAEYLIERDEAEVGTTLGQDVKDAFPRADLFVDVTDKEQLERNIRRFVELIFGYPFHTPTRDEFGMYHARSAALRSSDLARQVGASIASKECDLISVGCNDVPKAGGGLYWPGDKPDGRDFQSGFDASNEQREQIIAEILSRFRTHGLLADNASEVKQLVEAMLVGNKRQVLKGTQVLGLIEFGRSVHAEMAAIIDASRRGVSVKNATLFTTTFPCHLCARHIIAAGIDRVVYIEPYPKSKAKDFYSDSIAFDPSKHTIGRVRFEPFVGVAPRLYMDIFEMQASDSRKDDSGRIVEWPKADPVPRVRRFMNTYMLMEQKLIAEFIPELAKKLGVNSALFGQP